MQTFGKYKLTERLAIGGMAEVFRATVHGEAGFSKPVVIKRLHPRLSEDREFVNMLIDEARITSQLHHSNICQVLDLGSVEGSYYIAMEHIAGEDLRTVHDHFIRMGQHMPVEAALYIIAEMLAGLHYAHEKEGVDGKPLHIIHRDVSPQNVLVSYEGEVKVIDFGIARARTRMVKTQAGVIKGKFRYMAPEQASGGSLDHRTDVFAAGIVLYELLRGGPHLVDVPDTEVLRRMRDAAFEPLSDLRPDLPPALTALTHRALERKPRRRYRDAGTFREAIVTYMREQRMLFGRGELAGMMRDGFGTKRRRVSGEGAKQRSSAPAEPAPPKREVTEMLEDDALEAISDPMIRAAAGPGYTPTGDTGRRAAAQEHSEAAYAMTAAVDTNPDALATRAARSRGFSEAGRSAPMAAPPPGRGQGGAPGVVAGSYDASPIRPADTEERTQAFVEPMTMPPQSEHRPAGAQGRLSRPRGRPGQARGLPSSGARRAPAPATPPLDEIDSFEAELELEPAEEPSVLYDTSDTARSEADLARGHAHAEEDARRTVAQVPGETVPAESRRRRPRDRLAGGTALAWSSRDSQDARVPVARAPSYAAPATPRREATSVVAPRGRGDERRQRRDRERDDDEGGGALRRVFGWLITLVVLAGILAGAAYAAWRMGLIELPGLGSGSGSGLAKRAVAGGGSGSGSGSSDGGSSSARIARVELWTRPNGATVRICGDLTGEKTPFIAEVAAVAPRRCTIVFSRRGYRTAKRRVLLEPGKLTRVPKVYLRKRGHRIRVEKLPSGRRSGDSDGSGGGSTAGRAAMPAGRGRLIVTSVAVGTVYANGVRIGKTPRVTRALRPGFYDVRVSFKSRGAKTVRVEIVAGRSRRLHVEPPE